MKPTPCFFLLVYEVGLYEEDFMLLSLCSSASYKGGTEENNAKAGSNLENLRGPETRTEQRDLEYLFLSPYIIAIILFS